MKACRFSLLFLTPLSLFLLIDLALADYRFQDLSAGEKEKIIRASLFAEDNPEHFAKQQFQPKPADTPVQVPPAQQNVQIVNPINVPSERGTPTTDFVNGSNQSKPSGVQGVMDELDRNAESYIRRKVRSVFRSLW